MTTPTPTLRRNSPVVNDWDTLQIDTTVHRYFDSQLMYDSKPVKVVWKNSDAVGVSLPDLLNSGHEPVRFSRGDLKDPRKGNQFTRA